MEAYKERDIPGQEPSVTVYTIQNIERGHEMKRERERDNIQEMYPTKEKLMQAIKKAGSGNKLIALHPTKFSTGTITWYKAYLAGEPDPLSKYDYKPICMTNKQIDEAINRIHGSKRKGTEVNVYQYIPEEYITGQATMPQELFIRSDGVRRSSTAKWNNVRSAGRLEA